MELFKQKLDLLQRFKDNEVIISKLIEEANFEYVIKRLEQNNFLIRQIDEIDKKIIAKGHETEGSFVDNINKLASEIKTLHTQNINNLEQRRAGFKVEALKSNQAKKPIRAYTRNLMK